MAREKHPERYEGLLRAVLLFHRGGPWVPEDSLLFNAYLSLDDGETEVTTRRLCDAIREALGDA